MRTAAVVLAAGASRRLGEPKQMVELGGETLLDRAVRTAGEAGLEPVMVVLGAEAERVAARCELRGCSVVMNGDWAEGMGSSVRAGMERLESLAAIEAVAGVVLLTCDMPGITPEHLRLLVAEPDGSAASVYGGRRGVPAYFPRARFPALLRLGGDAGARELLREAREIALPGGELDVDTPDDLRRLQTMVRGEAAG